jgi:hypothetical protein
MRRLAAESLISCFSRLRRVSSLFALTGQVTLG